MASFARLLAACLILGAATAHATTTLQIVGPGFPTGMSADGSVVVGTMPGSYEVFRWTQGTGTVPLGMCSGCVLGRVGGNPSVSEDGNVISGTIITPDSLYATPGIWRAGSGWQCIIPPVPPEGGLLDDSYGSAWAVSGDGLAVGGFYWRPGQPGGLAHAYRWTGAGGLVDLGSSGQDSRVSAANYDGSVMAGWDSDPVDHHWRATVWVNGVMTTLTPSAAFTEVRAVNPDGTILAGQDYDDAKHLGIAVLWKWNGSSWVRTVIGTLPGTFAYYGEAYANDMTPNGRVAVGFNDYDNSSTAGFVWDPVNGMTELTQFLALEDVYFPADFYPTSLTAISHDGRTMVGGGRGIFPPYAQQWFLIRTDRVLDVPAAPAARGIALSAFPNPVRGASSIAFELPEAGEADLAVYDVSGRRLRTLASGQAPAGETRVRWDGHDARGVPAAAGVYYLRLRYGQSVESRRIVIVK
jgi:uncharacterized membrane protein